MRLAALYSPTLAMLLAHFVGDVRCLTLHRLLAGGNRIAAANRGTLQCVNHVLRYLPLFVALEFFGHVV